MQRTLLFEIIRAFYVRAFNLLVFYVALLAVRMVACSRTEHPWTFMASETSCSPNMEYTILENVKSWFFLPDKVNSFEQLIEHVQEVRDIFCDLKNKGWVFSANSGDWFEIIAPNREAAVEHVGEEYVKHLEEEHQEAISEIYSPAD